jgi:hypothetical protein
MINRGRDCWTKPNVQRLTEPLVRQDPWSWARFRSPEETAFLLGMINLPAQEGRLGCRAIVSKTTIQMEYANVSVVNSAPEVSPPSATRKTVERIALGR